MAGPEDSLPECNGITKELINFPKVLLPLPYELDFDEDDEKPVPELTTEQCRNFMDTICGLGDLLVAKGVVKFKLNDVDIEGSEWEERYRSLVNREEITNKAKDDDDIDIVPDDEEDELGGALEQTSGTSRPQRQAAVKASSKIKRIAKSEIIKPKKKGKKVKLFPLESELETYKVAKFQPLFVLLKEIRRLGHSVFRMKHHKVDESIKILPQLEGVTMGQLIDFYGKLFGPCVEGDIQSQRAYVKRYFQILESLPADPSGEWRGDNPKAGGLLIPYIHTYDNVSINDDDNITGLDMESVKGALLDLDFRIEGGRKIGNINGINNTMMFYGVAGSTFVTHLEDGNAYGSINRSVIGTLKFWDVNLSKYAHDIRRNVKLVFEKLIEEGLDKETKNEINYECALQHKMTILAPGFFNQCKPNPIPHRIFMQRKSELIVVGTGVHHSGASGGEVEIIGKATNIVPSDYHMAMPISIKQCDGHGDTELGGHVLEKEEIELFRISSVNDYRRGFQKEKERAVQEALEEFKKLHISHAQPITSVVEVPKPAGTMPPAPIDLDLQKPQEGNVQPEEAPDAIVAYALENGEVADTNVVEVVADQVENVEETSGVPDTNVIEVLTEEAETVNESDGDADTNVVEVVADQVEITKESDGDADTDVLEVVADQVESDEETIRVPDTNVAEVVAEEVETAEETSGVPDKNVVEVVTGQNETSASSLTSAIDAQIITAMDKMGLTDDSALYTENQLEEIHDDPTVSKRSGLTTRTQAASLMDAVTTTWMPIIVSTETVAIKKTPLIERKSADSEKNQENAATYSPEKHNETIPTELSERVEVSNDPALPMVHLEQMLSDVERRSKETQTTISASNHNALKSEELSSSEASGSKIPKRKRDHIRTDGKVSADIKCGKCGKEFHQHSDLDHHIKRESCKRDNACEHCGKRYQFYKNLLNHQDKCKMKKPEVPTAD